MSGFIPPPFPFVEAWPRVFSAAGQSRWLTPSTALRLDGGGGGVDAAGAWYSARAMDAGQQAEILRPTERRVEQEPSAEPEQDDDDDDDEYEYEFVLTDEWRERLIGQGSAGRQYREHSSGGDDDGRRQDRRPAPKRPSYQTKRKKPALPARSHPRSKGSWTPGAGSSSRAKHLQDEIEDAKNRELAMRWRLERAAGGREPSAAVRRLEASMTARFDEFCDAFEPVVWPHAAAR